MNIDLFVLVLLTSIFFLAGVESVQIDLDNVDFKLKWLTRSTRMPLRLEKNLDAVPFDADFKWYRYPDRHFINEIDNYEQSYRYRQTEASIELDIVRYDKHTHEQLSSYIAVPVAFRSGGGGGGSDGGLVQADFRNEFFTIAYFDRQEIEVDEQPGLNAASTIDFYCNVSIMIPYADIDLNKKNIDLVQKNLDLRMGLLDAENMRLSENKRFRQVRRRPNRVKRAIGGKNLIVFLQLNENIGPLSIYKDQLESLRRTKLYCDVDLLEDGATGAEEKVVVYSNRIQKEIGEFGLGKDDKDNTETEDAQDDDYDLFPSENNAPSSKRRLFDAFMLSFLFHFIFILVFIFL